MQDQRIIMGIDPGTRLLGYGVVLLDRKKTHFVDMGVVDLRKETDHFLKLKRITAEIGALIDRYHPHHVAVEAPFYGKNPQVMLKLGRAQGAALAAALIRDLPVFEYAPRKVKMAITGNGSASKEQVAMILSKTLRVDLQGPYLDATDALAIAMCHYYQLTNPFADQSASTDWASFLKSHPERLVK